MIRLEYDEFAKIAPHMRKIIRETVTRATTKPRDPEKSRAIVDLNYERMLKIMPRLCVDGYYRYPEDIREMLADGHMNAVPFHDPLRDNRNVNDFPAWKARVKDRSKVPVTVASLAVIVLDQAVFLGLSPTEEEARNAAAHILGLCSERTSPENMSVPGMDRELLQRVMADLEKRGMLPLDLKEQEEHVRTFPF